MGEDDNATVDSFSTPLSPHHNANQDPMSISWDDATWIMTSSFIIFTMQSGFGLLESGCVTRKNEVNIMVKNAVDVIFGGLGYWMFGYGMSFGKDQGSNSFIGFGSFFVDAEESEMGVVFATYIFQLSFATTATTIVSGAMAERCNFVAYCVFSFFNTVVFCLPAGWIWGPIGFLRNLQVVDIAGCAAVHLVGGASALVAAIMLKPRTGRYENGTEQPPMGSPTNALVGMFMLWWGWLGFNCGSTFGVSGHKWKYAARSAIATINSSVGGGITALAFSYILHNRKFMILSLINGILASLVSITGGCALYHPWEAIIVGAVGSLLVNAAMPLLDKLKIDDPVGAISVHGVGSIWGMLAVGLLVEKDSLLLLSKGHAGLFRNGGWYLLGIQALAVLIITAWSAVTTFILLYLINKVVPIRMALEAEIAGADFTEHNIRYDWDSGAPPTSRISTTTFGRKLESRGMKTISNSPKLTMESTRTDPAGAECPPEATENSSFRQSSATQTESRPRGRHMSSRRSSSSLGPLRSSYQPKNAWSYDDEDKTVFPH